jgi:hypothetical protein
MKTPKLRKLAPIQNISLFEDHVAWLDAQAKAGLDRDKVARAAIDSFLNTLEAHEQQRWIEIVLTELPKGTPTMDVAVNAALERFRAAHGEEFA